MKDLGIDLCFSDETITWDNHDVPFKDADAEVHEAHHVVDPGPLDEAVERLKSILDAKHAPADLEQIARDMTHMSDDEKQMFLATLRKYETLFGGTLGHWKDQDLTIELKEGSKPYHARSFPMPKVWYIRKH